MRNHQSRVASRIFREWITLSRPKPDMAPPCTPLPPGEGPGVRVGACPALIEGLRLLAMTHARRKTRPSPQPAPQPPGLKAGWRSPARGLAARKPRSPHRERGFPLCWADSLAGRSRWSFAFAALLLAVLMGPALAQDPESNAPAPAASEYRSLDALRRGAPLTEEPPAAPMARVENADLRRQRGWPEQPPTIPHSIDGYQVTKNANRCMICHSRAGAEQFQAPMVSVTHFMDRDGQVLAQVSPRRYFCVQCHVVQTDAKLLVENGFRDIDQVLASGKEP